MILVSMTTTALETKCVVLMDARMFVWTQFLLKQVTTATCYTCARLFRANYFDCDWLFMIWDSSKSKSLFSTEFLIFSRRVLSSSVQFSPFFIACLYGWSNLSLNNLNLIIAVTINRVGSLIGSITSRKGNTSSLRIYWYLP